MSDESRDKVIAIPKGAHKGLSNLSKLVLLGVYEEVYPGSTKTLGLRTIAKAAEVAYRYPNIVKALDELVQTGLIRMESGPRGATISRPHAGKLWVTESSTLSDEVTHHRVTTSLKVSDDVTHLLGQDEKEGPNSKTTPPGLAAEGVAHDEGAGPSASLQDQGQPPPTPSASSAADVLVHLPKDLAEDESFISFQAMKVHHASKDFSQAEIRTILKLWTDNPARSRRAMDGLIGSERTPWANITNALQTFYTKDLNKPPASAGKKGHHVESFASGTGKYSRQWNPVTEQFE